MVDGVECRWGLHSHRWGTGEEGGCGYRWHGDRHSPSPIYRGVYTVYILYSSPISPSLTDYEEIDLAHMRGWRALGPPVPVTSFDFYHVDLQPWSASLRLRINADGTCNAVAFWFDLHLGERRQFECAHARVAYRGQEWDHVAPRTVAILSCHPASDVPVCSALPTLPLASHSPLSPTPPPLPHLRRHPSPPHLPLLISWLHMAPGIAVRPRDTSESRGCHGGTRGTRHVRVRIPCASEGGSEWECKRSCGHRSERGSDYRSKWIGICKRRCQQRCSPQRVPCPDCPGTPPG